MKLDEFISAVKNKENALSKEVESDADRILNNALNKAVLNSNSVEGFIYTGNSPFREKPSIPNDKFAQAVQDVLTNRGFQDVQVKYVDSLREARFEYRFSWPTEPKKREKIRVDLSSVEWELHLDRIGNMSEIGEPAIQGEYAGTAISAFYYTNNFGNPQTCIDIKADLFEMGMDSIHNQYYADILSLEDVISIAEGVLNRMIDSLYE